MFVFWWSVTLTSRMMSDSHFFDQLEQYAYDVHTVLTTNAGNEQDSHAFIDMLARNQPTRQLVLTGNTEVVRRNAIPATQQLSVPELVPGQSVRLNVTGNQGQPLLGWFGGFNAGDGELVLGVIEDVSGLRAKLSLFHWFSAIFAVLLLIVLLTVQHLILRRSVEKLEGIRRDMLRLEHGQAVALSEDVPTEIMPLVLEFNDLLRRFEQRLRQSRNAVGNLAHSLKGPLNLLLRSTEAERIGDVEKVAIASNAEHIRRLIESELKRARLAGRGAIGIRFDFAAELPAMIGLLEQVYPEKGVAVSYTIDEDVELVHDRQDMLELIGNLLDNAVKWCHTTVKLRLSSADGVVIDVEDDGPGCSPEVLDRLTERGVRLDESVAGHGLGLSIVKDITDTYDGQLSLLPSQALGGLKVSVYLPRRV